MGLGVRTPLEFSTHFQLGRGAVSGASSQQEESYISIVKLWRVVHQVACSWRKLQTPALEASQKPPMFLAILVQLNGHEKGCGPFLVLWPRLGFEKIKNLNKKIAKWILKVSLPARTGMTPSVGMSSYTKRLWDQSPVRSHMEGNQSMFLFSLSSSLKSKNISLGED